MLAKIGNGWSLIKASASVLRQDKELLLFPVLSGTALVVVSLSFALPFFFVGNLAAGASVGAYVVGFAFYLVQYFVIIFFNAALVGAAMIRLDGGDPTVMDGLRIAWRRIGAILGYAAIAATVGLLLQTARERAGWIGRLAIGMVGMAWNLATFLVVPVLVVREIGPIDAIKESANVLRRTWGEQVAGNVGISLVFGLIYLVLGLVALPFVLLAAQTGQPLVIGGVVVAAVLVGLLLAAIQAGLSGIYAAALYRFASTGDAGNTFDSQQMRQAFLPK